MRHGLLASGLLIAACHGDFLSTELLGRPTDRSITVNAILARDGETWFEWGTEPGNHPNHTEAEFHVAGHPIEQVLEPLLPDTTYYYAIRHRKQGGSDAESGDEHAFHTWRPRGGPYTFTIQADSHLDALSDLDLYLRTLGNVAADDPDFHIDLGDTFMCGQYSHALSDHHVPAPDPRTVDDRYLYERSNFGEISASIPLFLVIGNHDAEQGWRTDDMATWATEARKRYYPNPRPDGFYSGDPEMNLIHGLHESYYAWEWGDALFVVLDPFWHTQRNPFTTDQWTWTLGDAQYAWLTEVLTSSSAPFKMVFIHHLVGGLPVTDRGGIEVAPYYEWGGHNTDGTWGFDEKRPGWALPVHDLMVAGGVTVLFHGHDHLYAMQDLDGIVYQAVPQPSNPHLEKFEMQREDGGYESGVVFPASGHLRVMVSPSELTVDYVRAWLPEDEAPNQVNGEVTWSYSIPAR